MANILFVTYHDFTSNSAIHIHTFANQLVKNGHSCIVAVPCHKDTVYEAIGGEVLYTPLGFDDLRGGQELFPDGKWPDIIHAWTPREIVRKECVPLVNQYKCKLVVHLEDNEEQIIADNFGIPLQYLKKRSMEEMIVKTPDHLSHLFLYRDFLEMADGITIIMDTLSDFVPEDKECMILWPGIDIVRFQRNHIDCALKESLGINNNTLVLCYTGNVHASNYREVRSLYLATALLNRIGIATILIRTGVDHVSFLGDDTSWAHQYSIELGFVPHEMIPRLLSIADILIQPGKADAFNSYRLPSKLPEFFYMKKPVILPNVNIGRFITDGKEGLLLNEGGAIEILEKIKMIYDDKMFADSLSRHAGEFAEQSFNVIKNTRKLDSFYKRILGDCCITPNS